MRDIGIGIIGTGFMGRAHALAYRAVSGIFPVELRPVLEIVADNNPEAGQKAHRQLGFKRMTEDWRELVGDPAIEKMHARIVQQGNRYYLNDLNTPGGTFLNGQRVREPMPLRDGDAIRVGACTVRFGERAKR